MSRKETRRDPPPLAFTIPNAYYRKEVYLRARGCVACFGLDSAPKNIDYGKDLVPGFARNGIGAAVSCVTSLCLCRMSPKRCNSREHQWSSHGTLVFANKERRYTDNAARWMRFDLSMRSFHDICDVVRVRYLYVLLFMTETGAKPPCLSRQIGPNVD